MATRNGSRKGYAIRQLSANGVQLLLNQLFSVAIFYLLSIRLSKNDFGRINMAFAILLGLYGALSLGMDSLAVKKTAAGEDRKIVLHAYLLHVIVTGVSGLLLLWVAAPWLPNHLLPLLPLLGLGKLFIFLSTPFKQITSGLEKFAILARMSLISNALRCVGLVILVATGSFTLSLVVLLFIAGDLAELIASVFLFRSAITTKADQHGPVAAKSGKQKSRLPVAAWRRFLREVSPQAAVVIFTALLSRFDWICIGFLSTPGRLAEYGFAYKAFEMAQLPLLMIAPLLLTGFTRFYQQDNRQPQKLLLVLHGELFVAAGTAFLIAGAWAPFIDLVTGGRYGAVNKPTIILLCCCLPLIYCNNFLWSSWFALGHLRAILFSFLLAGTVNVAGCLLLIPLLGNTGAALAFLLSMAAQSLYYLLHHRSENFRAAWKPLCLYGAAALVSAWAAAFFSDAPMVVLASALIYFSLVGIFSPLPEIAYKNLREVLSRYATRQPVNP